VRAKQSAVTPVLATADARRIDGAREAISDKIDVAGVFGRRDRYVTNWHDVGQANTVAEMGVELVRGHARLDGTRRVRVVSADQRVNQLTARHAVVICTGSTAAVPDIPGIAEANPWTNRKGTDSSTVPTRLAVVGGGGVGVEMATAWQGLGSQVTLLARTPRLLPRMEPFVGEFVARGLSDAGVDVRVGVNITELQRSADSGAVDVTLDCGDHVVVDEILFATGRTPNTKDVGVETVGLMPGAWLDVDDSCLVRGVDETWLYALGDVNHRALLTHQGKYQARVAANVISARARGDFVDTAPWGAYVTTADSKAVPQAVFHRSRGRIGWLDRRYCWAVGISHQDGRRQHRRCGDRRKSLRRWLHRTGASRDRSRRRHPPRRIVRRARGFISPKRLGPSCELSSSVTT
jgi:pyruvate/2-oxoglutarate dehydrogenase complex dihydrolipoamide dehydrogenase (E3) component